MKKMIDQREQLEKQSAVVVASYNKQVADLESNLSHERKALQRKQQELEATEASLAQKLQEYASLEKAAEDETRRLNGNYLRAKGDVREANEALEDAKIQAPFPAAMSRP